MPMVAAERNRCVGHPYGVPPPARGSGLSLTTTVSASTLSERHRDRHCTNRNVVLRQPMILLVGGPPP
jgi:hypothetical protein